MQYYIRKTEEGHTLAKFDSGSEPVVVYTVKGKSCDCPAGLHRGRCKHIEMIANWREGYYYEDSSLVPLGFTEPLLYGDLFDI